MKALSRRVVLNAALGTATTILISRVVSAAEPPMCADPQSLPASQRSMRQSLGFQPVSESATKKCGSCAFFAAKPASLCGACALLSGGLVANTSICGSWVRKG